MSAATKLKNQKRRVASKLYSLSSEEGSLVNTNYTGGFFRSRGFYFGGDTFSHAPTALNRRCVAITPAFGLLRSASQSSSGAIKLSVVNDLIALLFYEVSPKLI